MKAVLELLETLQIQSKTKKELEILKRIEDLAKKESKLFYHSV